MEESSLQSPLFPSVAAGVVLLSSFLSPANFGRSSGHWLTWGPWSTGMFAFVDSSSWERGRPKNAAGVLWPTVIHVWRRSINTSAETVLRWPGHLMEAAWTPATVSSAPEPRNVLRFPEGLYRPLVFFHLRGILILRWHRKTSTFPVKTGGDARRAASQPNGWYFGSCECCGYIFALWTCCFLIRH